MVSGEAVVETGVKTQDSDLKQASAQFQETAETKGWVQESGSLLDFANSLFGAGSSEDSAKPKSYASLIGADVGSPSAVFARVARDAAEAELAFTRVNRKADVLLKSREVVRGDVVGYEGSLVLAQKTYRNLAEAVGMASARGGEGEATAEQALKSLSIAIDDARLRANRMAGLYAVADSTSAAS